MKPKSWPESFINDLEARGGTNIGDALHAGATMLDETSDRPAYIVLMTDGEPTVGETNIDVLLKSVPAIRDIRVFDFGVGYNVNTRLLTNWPINTMARLSTWNPRRILRWLLPGSMTRSKSPVLSNIKISYNGVEVKDVYPRDSRTSSPAARFFLSGSIKQAAKPR